jgi:uncharacterized Zn finger protein
MSPKKVNFLYCEYCGWKKVCRDYSTIKSYEIEDKKFKCQSCGRLIKLKLIEDYQKKLKIELDNKSKKEEFEKWIKENAQE